MTEAVGTPLYVAPEVLTRNYNEKCDIYSIGVVCFMCLVAAPPVKGRTDKEIYANVRNNKFDGFNHPDWIAKPDECKAMVVELLQTDPELRPQAKTVMGSNSWLRVHGKNG